MTDQRITSIPIDPVKLDRLAEVAVKVGLGLRPGQDLLLTAPAIALPLVRRIAVHAYKAGAGIVTPILADAIFAASRVDREDAMGNWASHNAVLRERTNWLNGQHFRALQYSGPGIDLTIGLADGHEWEGGASLSKNGISCNANIPTEEVFTTPHCRRVYGHVVSSKPLSYQGTLIDNIAVRFEEGRIVEAKASRGEEVL